MSTKIRSAIRNRKGIVDPQETRNTDIQQMRE